MDLVILSISQYKEKDAVITAISERETITFLAKGVFNEKKVENTVLNTPGLEIDASFLDNKQYKHLVLKDYTIINTPLNSEYSLSTLLTLSFLTEVTTKLLPSEEMYILFNPLMECLSLIKENVDYNLLSLVYLLVALRYAGYSFEVNECINCHSKEGIIDFSFDEGGLLCKNCIGKGYKREFNSDDIKIIRFIINRLDKISDIVTEGYFDKEIIEKILNRAIIFTSDSLGVSINSVKMMKKE